MVIELEIIATDANKQDLYYLGIIKSLATSPKSAAEDLAKSHCRSRGYYFVELREK